MTYSMVEDAPVSPRGAAIYYWGGEEEELYNSTNSIDTKKNDKEMDYLYASTFHKRVSYSQRRRRTTVRFHLTLHDEGDADHWMFATTAATTDLSLNDEKEEEKEEEEVRDDDFATPNADSEPKDFDSIPIIDLSQPKEVYAKQIGDACRNVGFFYIVNHGVDQKVVDGIMDMSRNFFDLDLSAKLKVSSRNSSGEENKKGYRGYFEIGGEDLDNKDGTRDLLSEEGGVHISNNNETTTKKGDYKEGYDCGLSNNEDALLFFGDNMWPDEVENPSIVGFREHVNQYQSELIRLSDKLLLALGLCLNDNLNGGSDIAEDYFIKQSRHPLCTLRLLHYPATNDSPVTSSSSQGCGAHTGKSAFVLF